MLRKPYLSACFKAKAILERVLAPPVGTRKENKPGGSSAALRQHFKTESRASLVGLGCNLNEIHSMLLNRIAKSSAGFNIGDGFTEYLINKGEPFKETGNHPDETQHSDFFNDIIYPKFISEINSI